ncbi:MAG: thymidylate kinase [Candidatus Binatia bacterium]|nr:MAG: thymidylate kinase [Candidatus Binatia bacterium]
MKKTRGRLIAFEGVEGAGKSTQVRLLAAALRRQGRSVLVTAEPGGTKVGRAIRTILTSPRYPEPVPLAELLLYLADRAQHLAEVVRPALERGLVVLTDRFSASTVAYQGYGRGLPLGLVRDWDRKARGGVRADLTVLLDCPVREGLRRARGSDRLHTASLEFHERVRAGFLAQARREKGWVVVSSYRREPAEVAREILARVERARILPPCTSEKS